MRFDLSPDVLAALGAYQHRSGRLERGAGLKADPQAFVPRALETGTVRCRVNPESLGQLELSAGDRQHLFEAWQRLESEYKPDAHRRMLRVVLEPYASRGLGALRRAIAQASAVGSVFIGDYAFDKSGKWHWPLRVGFLPDHASQELRQATVESYRHPRLLEVVELGTGAAACDLLIVPSVRHLELLGPATDVRSILVIGRPGEKPSVQWMRKKGRELGASAFGYVSGLSDLGQTRDFFGLFVDELSHDHPLDVALSHSAPLDAESRPGYELVANPSFVERARVTSILDRLREEVEEAGRKGLITPADAQRTRRVMDDLQVRLRDVGWKSERGGATESAAAIEEVSPVLDDIESAAPAEPRWLQGQVYERSAGGWQRRRGSFRAATRHQVRLRIGPGDVDWMKVDRPLDESSLPAGQEFHELEVILASSQLPEGAQMKTIELPAAHGPSSPADFEITVPDGIEILEASVAVLYDNRHLQSAVLRGRVAVGADDPQAAEPIAWLPGETSRADFGQPSTAAARPAGAGPDLFLQLNAEDVIVRYRGEEPLPPVSLAGLRKLTETISGELYSAAWGAAQLDLDALDHGPGLDLVRLLAAQGRFLKERLLGAGGALDQVEWVQVVSSFSAESLPVEFFYDGPAPDDGAKLCDGFPRGKAGDRDCRQCRLGANGSDYVCPLRFWGLNRIVERQIRDQPRDRAGRDAKPAQPEPTAGRDRLSGLRRIVLAASDQVTAKDQQETLAAVRAVDPQAHQAADWKDWKDWVESHGPGLLVALPHNVVTATKFEALEIGADARLRLDLVEKGWPKPGEPGPVVLLLGCNTAKAEITYQDFVGEIRRCGASVVVGTLTTVLGRYAAPVACEFVRLLSEAPAAGTKFGEVVRDVRTGMLRAGNVMALALTAYGSSEWRLGA